MAASGPYIIETLTGFPSRLAAFGDHFPIVLRGLNSALAVDSVGGLDVALGIHVMGGLDPTLAVHFLGGLDPTLNIIHSCGARVWLRENFTGTCASGNLPFPFRHLEPERAVVKIEF